MAALGGTLAGALITTQVAGPLIAQETDKSSNVYEQLDLFGDIFEKGIGIKAGQTHVQKYMPELLEAIEEGKLRPHEIISHRLPLAQAAEGYKMFDKKEDDCRKVILTP